MTGMSSFEPKNEWKYLQFAVAAVRCLTWASWKVFTINAFFGKLNHNSHVSDIIIIFCYSPKHFFRLIEGQQYHCWSEKSPALGLELPTLGIQGRCLHHSSTKPLFFLTKFGTSGQCTLQAHRIWRFLES